MWLLAGVFARQRAVDGIWMLLLLLLLLLCHPLGIDWWMDCLFSFLWCVSFVRFDNLSVGLTREKKTKKTNLKTRSRAEPKSILVLLVVVKKVGSRNIPKPPFSHLFRFFKSQSS